MPRRREVPKRRIIPDPKFKDKLVAKFTNSLMLSGKKATAESILYGAFDVIFEKVRTRTADLIQNTGKSNDPEAKKIGDYYDAFMNEDAIEKKGLTPIKAELDEINAISDKTALARLLGSQFGPTLMRSTTQTSTPIDCSVFGCHPISTILLTTYPIFCRAAWVCRIATTT